MSQHVFAHAPLRIQGVAMESIAARGPRRFVAVLVLASLLAPGCLWLRYRSMATTHAELLVQFAGDAAELTEAGLEVGDRDLSRLEYPMARAEQFVTSARSLPGERPSLVALQALVGRYREMFVFLQGLRARRATPEEAQRVKLLAESVLRAGADFEAALAAD